ncbi:C1QL4-like protein [Mya arenaria]|uniref:C1QL4-like protein n=1 Tax=Mya arenaria TaxID=6604 RepID=A0ABY7GA70_MYAAR|nr:uncharacterized protein LOC128223875 [Mya arenaria]WAR31323.1 C1QL4-like protein [Mya arenaria]
MYFSKHIRELIVIVLVIESSLCDMNEPRCYSRFDYEEKMLEKMVRTEIKMEELLGKLDALGKRQMHVETEVDSSVEDIHALEKRLTHAETEVDTSVKDSQVLKKRLTQLETELDNSTKEIHGLEKKHDIEKEKSVKAIHDLEERYNSLQTDLKKNENTTKSYFDVREKSLEVFDQRLDAISKNITEGMHQSPVAFFAILSTDLRTTSSFQTLVFTKVVTDVGGGYNPGTGVFTTPVDGLYVFSTSVMVNLSTSTTFAHIRIDKNGGKVAYLYANDSDGDFETVSGTIILSLKVGDNVKMLCDQSGRTIHEFSIFSGFRLE